MLFPAPSSPCDEQGEIVYFGCGVTIVMHNTHTTMTILSCLEEENSAFNADKVKIEGRLPMSSFAEIFIKLSTKSFGLASVFQRDAQNTPLVVKLLVDVYKKRTAYVL